MAVRLLQWPVEKSFQIDYSGKRLGDWWKRLGKLMEGERVLGD
jgi:hypothetical protein